MDMQARVPTIAKAAAGSKAPLIELSHIRKRYDGQEMLSDISLQVRQGEFVSIIGPSGSGKSTLFHIITGLVPADEGEWSVQGSIGYMQQKDLLLPWKSVLDNIALPLAIRGVSKKERSEKAKPYIAMAGLGGYESKYPHQLSGGMRQRASFVRTLLTSDEIMLLDEPFGALDSITKSKMQQWLLEMKEALNLTILFITHDIEEAVFLSDRIYVLSSVPGTAMKELKVDFHPYNKQDRLTSEQLLKYKERIVGML